MAVSTSEPGLVIGRAADCGLVISHPSVSAHHAELHFDGEQFWLRDLSSANGTFVNGVRVTSSVLNEGDNVHLGPIALEFTGGQLQIRVDYETEPSEETPSAVTKKKPLLIAAAVVAVSAAIAIPVLIGGSDDTQRPDELATTPTTLPVTTTAAPATTAVSTTTAAPATTAAPVTTSSGLTAAEIAGEALLTASYRWGYSEETSRLQELLGVTVDGMYGYGTRTAHVAALRGRGLSTSGVPASPPTTTQPLAMEADWEQVARSVVYIEAFCDGEWYSGSGTIVLDGEHVLTNHHVVVADSGGFCELTVFGMESLNDDLVFVADGEVIRQALDGGLDLAVIRLVDVNGRIVKAAGRTPIEVVESELGLGEEVKVLGFPGMGGQSLTMTSGDIAGRWEDDLYGLWTGEFYKTDAKMGPGVSGGAAFNAETGEFVGVATGTPGEEERGDILGLVRPARYAIPLLEAAARAN